MGIFGKNIFVCMHIQGKTNNKHESLMPCDLGQISSPIRQTQSRLFFLLNADGYFCGERDFFHCLEDTTLFQMRWRGVIMLCWCKGERLEVDMFLSFDVNSAQQEWWAGNIGED